MRSLWIVMIPVMMLLFGGCSANKEYKYFNQNLDEEKVVTEVSDEEYEAEKRYEWKIQPGDRLEIRVFNQSASSVGGQMTSILDQSLTYMNRSGVDGMLVPPDGKIHIPLIGTVAVEGLTETKAAQRLTQEYKKYLRNPFVSVKILNQRLLVLGEVGSPGVVPVNSGTMTLFEALAMTGDLTDDAMRTNILIIRGDLRHPQVRKVDLTDMRKLRVASLILRPNDIVYVQPRNMKAIMKEMVEMGSYFNFLNTIMSPFLTYQAIDQGYNIGIVPGNSGN
ncbi:polysaccharide biosynthesis/export family protein [Hydrogenimonas cancrithermarum]|uniref:Polysaccharide export outer membrane protein n=1 Tax=Hydrogenimonas cancrithermarum TaxID=2993563 RepID=A0ABN6WWT5_9BACT|nr:polysaccharide biosynthesis/export family protein [Hydrogenimonas cancrithermarum]BDY13527.1 polysaccharide export outer membrane protein [Hydrogenimonas cancrithermarum]